MTTSVAGGSGKRRPSFPVRIGIPHMEQREIEDVIAALRTAKRHGRKCTLLIGAGCSVKAGIPTAQGFIDIIEKKYFRAYNRADPKTYAQCMAKLTPGERKELIADYVDQAKINWAHVCIAQLMKSGYVDRVLTTNFDPLVIRACMLLDVLPGIYDLATSGCYKPAEIPDPAVFYLHGQRNGFVLVNTEEEFETQKKLLQPVFADSDRGRIWIVVGYSGQSDPLLERIAAVSSFEFGLYWIGYKEESPCPEVKDRILTGEKSAYYVPGFDADNFFITLTRNLHCFPPAIIAKPFTHLLSLLDELVPYSLSEQDPVIDEATAAREMIQEAIQSLEDTPQQGASKATAEKIHPALILQASANIMAGKYKDVIAIAPQGSSNPKLDEQIVWAYVMEGNSLAAKAKKKSGADADHLFSLAYEKYAAALKIKPDMHEALNNWGTALSDQAEMKSGPNADRLLTLACEKYEAALRIEPDIHEALNNWGITLSKQAETKSGTEADHLLILAYEKYEAALKIKPDKHEALYNWGYALTKQAETISGAAADSLLILACEKYEAALKIKPDMHEALYNWGYALTKQAETKSGAAADNLLILACEKYEAALKIKPDKYEVLNNWGLALLNQAKKKVGPETNQLFSAAKEKLLAAEALQPGISAYNLACLAALQEQDAECREWLAKSYKLGKLPTYEHLMEDPNLDRVRRTEWFQQFLAKVYPGH